MTTSVLIVDDHPILLQGCRRILEDIGIERVIEAQNIAAGYRQFLRHVPDMVVVDLSFQGSGLAGLALVERIKRCNPQARVLVLSMHSDPVVVTRALNAGATGYVIKDTSTEELVRAVNRVLKGLPYLSDDLANTIAICAQRTAGRPDTTRIADACPPRGRENLRLNRRRSQRELQDRGEYLLAAATEACREKSSGSGAYSSSIAGRELAHLPALPQLPGQNCQKVPRRAVT